VAPYRADTPVDIGGDITAAGPGTTDISAVTVSGRTDREAAAEHRRGVLYAVAAYGMWGLFPLYWVLLDPAAAVEILAHRISWTLVVVLVIVWLRGRRGRGRHELYAVLHDSRRLSLLLVAAAFITVNWGTFIWAVGDGHVVETSLGYFINPLVTVLAGVLVLGERLRPPQWAAVGLGACAVVVLTVGYGRPPWIALVLAFSFGTYGLIRKFASTGPVEALTVETTVLLLPALGYLVALEAAGRGTFFDHGAGHAALLAAGGAVTAVPLLAFGAAAIRVPLSLLGLLHYLTPMLQFACGVLVFGEHMPPARWLGFALVWLALALLTWDGLRRVALPAPAAD
jgi:chloramphenicol-sensitive protein RarD